MHCRFAPEQLPMEATPVDNLFILEYMHNADVTQLRVYLYGLMLCRYPSFHSASMMEALSLSEQELINAFAHWQREGLVRIISASPLEVEYIAPSERQAGPMLLPGKYAQLVQAVQSLLAPRTLRPAELRRVYDWVEVYNLEECAVIELISHCLERKGPRVSLSYIDTVARAWADDHVHTPAEAKAHADAFQALTGGAASILKRWNLSRLPTQDELALYEKWVTQWGYTQKAILAACPAMTKAERPSFAYLDGVLERLHTCKLHSESDVATHIAAADEDSAFAREVFSLLGAGRAARPNERAQLKAFLDAGLSKEILFFAARQAAGKERPFGFLKKLLGDYVDKGVRTLDEAQAAMDDHAGAYRQKTQNPASMDYPQKRYTDEELKHIFVNLDE
ncbi:MAG: DnaD domain protein [Clostridiales bacterium]|jgi:hypothetical protein|nr:DnaD domain protein [Clostridiales bacterium]